MKIDTDNSCAKLVRADDELVGVLAECWPLGARKTSDGNFCRLMMQADAREMWGVILPSAMPVAKDFMPEFLHLKRMVLPAALNAIAEMFGGAMLAGLFCHGNNFGEHGLAIFPAFRTRRSDNLKIQPQNAADRVSAFETILQHREWEVIREFLHVFNGLMTGLLGRKELYDAPLFLPAGMIHYEHDFMAINGKLVYIGVKPDSLEQHRQALSLLKISHILHLPVKMSAACEDEAYRVNYEDFYVTTTASINSDRGGIRICVPDLVGSLVADRLSIGWDGCVAIQPIGINQTLRIDPHHLRRLDRQVTSADKAGNIAIWNRRAVIAQEKLGWRGLILVKDQLVQYDVAVEELEKSTRSLSREAKKNAAPAMLKGLKKAVKRSLVVVLESQAAEKAGQAIDLLEKAVTAEEMLAATDFIFQAFNLEPEAGKTTFPPSGGPINFINDTSLRRPKLLLLYKIACKISHARSYSRAEIETIVIDELSSIHACRSADFRFQPDVVIRNLVDVGYLERDTEGTRYWLKTPSV